MATATTVTIERCGPAVRDALAQYAPQDCPRFESEMRDALHAAQVDLDLSAAEEVLRRWHARATIAANPLTEPELAQLGRARAGDFTGLRERHDDGTWNTL